MTLDLKALNRLLDELGPTVAQANDASPTPDPMTTKSVGDGLAAKNPYGSSYDFLSDDDSYMLQKRMNPLSLEEKGYLLKEQLKKGSGRGVPLEAWQAHKVSQMAEASGQTWIANALDTSGGGALIRQDLSPMLTSMFVSLFPAWARIDKVPANGLVDAWDQEDYATDKTSSNFISELGTVPDRTGSYTRKTTNIAVYGQRRGVSFKQQLAVQAGGMAWDSARLEIQNGLIQMAHDLQKTIFQGNATDSGGTASNELGAYDANAFTGLRWWLDDAINSGAAAVNFAPFLTSSADNFVTAFNQGITNTADLVGVTPTVAYMRYKELGALSNQQLSIQRVVDTTEFTPGVKVPGIMTAAGLMPLIAIPGDSIGHYTSATDSARDVADIYLVNEGKLQVPYLGDPGPSVIEIPPGVSGQLTRLYIVYGMFGLRVLSTFHSVKLRAEQRTS